MAYNNRYQYETSPRKLQPEYEPIKKKYPKKNTMKNKKIGWKIWIYKKKYLILQSKYSRQ